MFSKLDIAMSSSITALFVSAGQFVHALAVLGFSTFLISIREED